MPRSSPMNHLFAAYQADPAVGLEPLLTTARVRAVNRLQDQDLAQKFIIDLWQVLPSLPHGTNFSGWLNLRLRWAKLHGFRDDARGRKETPATYVNMPIDEDGQVPTNDEKLDYLAYLDRSKMPAYDMPNLESISDPFIRDVANLLIQGYSQAECAWMLDVTPANLRKRLQRYRETESLPVAA